MIYHLLVLLSVLCKKIIKISKEGLLGVAQVWRNVTEKRHRIREYFELKGTHKEHGV